MSTLLKTQEISDRLRLKPHTIQVWIRAGELKATRIGKQWLVPEEEVEKKRLTG